MASSENLEQEVDFGGLQAGLFRSNLLIGPDLEVSDADLRIEAARLCQKKAVALADIESIA